MYNYSYVCCNFTTLVTDFSSLNVVFKLTSSSVLTKMMIIAKEEKQHKTTKCKGKLVYKRVVLRPLKHNNYKPYIDKLSYFT